MAPPKINPSVKSPPTQGASTPAPVTPRADAPAPAKKSWLSDKAASLEQLKQRVTTNFDEKAATAVQSAPLLGAAAQLLRAAASKTAEVMVPGIHDAEDDAKIQEVRTAIQNHDEAGVERVLQNASPRLMHKIFFADLPQWQDPGKPAIAPDQYLTLQQTQPGQTLHVIFSEPFEKAGTTDALAGQLPKLAGLLDVLGYVKKNFPAGQQIVDGKLSGQTNFGYTKGVAGSGNVTHNQVQMVTITNEQTGKPMQVAQMTYSDPPWFNKAAGTGFCDQFRWITPNLCVANGTYGEYGDSGRFGQAAGPRPLGSAILSGLVGGKNATVSSDFLSFYLKRSPDVDAAQGT